jgi:sec-independent protein translocase protein TatA
MGNNMPKGDVKAQMAFDDPIVWVLIVAVVIFLFGANKIPQFAKAIGNAKKEFDQASKEITNPSSVTNNPQAAPVPVPASQTVQNTVVPSPQPSTQTTDPLMLAAQKEGIDTQGKTRDQIATEIAWKLKSK